MRKNDADTVASHRGLEWAAFMMGLSNSRISIDTNDTGYWGTPISALYLQDNFRVSKKLTLNLGLRWEREGGITERYSRGIESGFVYDAKLPITDAAQAAYSVVYAANPTLGLPDPSQFKVLGGLPYLGQYHDTLTDGTKRFLPRLGFAYQLNGKTVLRGGYGQYDGTWNVNNQLQNYPQQGYSQPTSVSISNDNGLNFLGSYAGAAFAAASLSASKNIMTDPFPVRTDNTRFDVPYGNTLDLMSRVGQNWNNGYYSWWRSVKPAYQQRWRLSVQRQIFSDVVIEAAYNGALSKIPVQQTLNYLPGQYWATGNARVQSVDDDLNRNVTNPFNIKNFASLQTTNPQVYKYISTLSFFTSTTIRKAALLRPFPQYNGVVYGLRPGVKNDDVRGNVNYGDLELRGEKRFSNNYSTSVSYTWIPKSTAADWYANEFDTAPSSRPNNQTRRHRFVWDSVIQFPFGKGQRWANQGFASHLAGGWEVGWIWQKQGGSSLGWGNRFYNGNLADIENAFNHESVWSKDIHQWFDPAMPFEKASSKQPGSYHVRVFPSRIDALRGPGIDNWDIKISRKIRIREQMSAAFSVDFLNAFNTTNFSDPNLDPTSTNFGKLTSQRGLSRVIQFNLRFVF